MTIATNMAGRGTDILLGGNPAGLASEALHKRGLNPAEVDKATYAEALAEAKAITAAGHEEVVAAGGLHIIGTERHDSRRIDNQLRGRAGRQGDPGSSRFYLSLEDDLMKRFASERVTGLMERLGLDEDTAIESRLVSKTIESAQSRVEGFNFDMRKRVVEYDDVINKQRETIYAERDKVLHNEDLTETIRGFIDDEIDTLVAIPPRRRRPAGVGHRRPGQRPRGHGRDRRGHQRRRAVGPGHARGHLRAPAGPADARLDAREAEVGAADWATVERMVLLRTIDSLWVEHLTEIDDMRRGIGLRGYAQQDPLNEFRREAFELYEELREPHPPRRGRLHLPRHRDPPAGGHARRRSGRRRQPGRGCRGARRAATDGSGDRERSQERGRRRCGSRRRQPVARRCRRPARPGSAIVKGALPAAPQADQDPRAARRCPAGGRCRRAPAAGSAGSTGGPAARVHAERCADRSQRRLLVRVGRQVQEVPRPLRRSTAAQLSAGTFEPAHETESRRRSRSISRISPLGDRSLAPYTVPSLPPRTARAPRQAVHEAHTTLPPALERGSP